MNRKKGFFKRLLDKISQENEKSFGAHKLDCCDLNKSKGEKEEKKKS